MSPLVSWGSFLWCQFSLSYYCFSHFFIWLLKGSIVLHLWLPPSLSLCALKLEWNKNNTNVDQHDKINLQKIFILEMTFEKWKKIMNLHKFHVMKWVNIWKRRWSALDDLFIHNSRVCGARLMGWAAGYFLKLLSEWIRWGWNFLPSHVNEASQKFEWVIMSAFWNVLENET